MAELQRVSPIDQEARDLAHQAMFAQLGNKIQSSSSFLSGGWRVAMVAGAIGWAVIQTAISVATLYHH